MTNRLKRLCCILTTIPQYAINEARMKRSKGTKIKYVSMKPHQTFAFGIVVPGKKEIHPALAKLKEEILGALQCR